MGGKGAMHDWACEQPVPFGQLDHIHLTSAGYRKLADGVVDELNRVIGKIPVGSK